MKNCKTCGASLENSALFCVMCGAKLEDSEQSALQSPPAANQIDYSTVLSDEQPKLSPREMFFKATSSTKALVAVVLVVVSFAISVLSNVINAFSVSNKDLWASFIDAATLANADQQYVESILGVMSSFFYIGVVIMLILSGINTAGIVLTYISSKKRATDTRGLTLLNVFCIAVLVMYGLIAALMIISLVAVPGGLIIALIGVAIGLVLPVFVQISFITTIGKMKGVVKHDHNVSIPTFVPIIMIVFCAFTALSGLTSGSIITMIICAISITSTLLLAICMLDYNNAIALMRVKNMYNAPTNRGNGL